MKKGDKVKVKETNHESTIEEIQPNGYIILKEPLPSHCCNFYAEDELELLPDFVILHTLVTDKDGNKVDSWTAALNNELKQNKE